MVMTDPIADMLTRIRNANQMKKETVDIPASKLKLQVLELLREEGYITNVVVINGNPSNQLRVTLKYMQNERVVKGLKRISKPGLRVYAKQGEIPKVLNGLGIAIISTSKGLMTDREARKQNVGGEILAYVW
ncbi:MAG: 30S ribosomal protein S8 [Candidatus Izemoplasmataceae bacterium]|jgi:small subunit ribosomal protein S8|uniref:30S ribosomal protein S8 n=1 Tax=Liberiplasma polymorphum TaxID=3374570 RepID=UPI003773EE8D